MHCKRLLTASILLSALLASAHAQDVTGKSEARQLVEETTPQAKARLVKREVQAAYEEAVADCKKMRGADRNTCMQEAKKQLQHDLTNVQKNPTTGQ